MNLRYTSIVSLFILTSLSVLLIPLQYIQLLAAPITLTVIYILLKNEIKLSPEGIDKQSIHMAYSCFIVCIIAQAILNFIGLHIFDPNQKITAISLVPVIPLYTVLFAPIIEETIFRYILFGVLQGNKKKFSFVAASISSALFAIVHLNLSYILGYFAVGFVLCYYYFKTKKLHVTILAHMLINFIALFIQSAHMTFGG